MQSLREGVVGKVVQPETEPGYWFERRLNELFQVGLLRLIGVAAWRAVKLLSKLGFFPSLTSRPRTVNHPPDNRQYHRYGNSNRCRITISKSPDYQVDQRSQATLSRK